MNERGTRQLKGIVPEYMPEAESRRAVEEAMLLHPQPGGGAGPRLP